MIVGVLGGAQTELEKVTLITLLKYFSERRQVKLLICDGFETDCSVGSAERRSFKDCWNCFLETARIAQQAELPTFFYQNVKNSSFFDQEGVVIGSLDHHLLRLFVKARQVTLAYQPEHKNILLTLNNKTVEIEILLEYINALPEKTQNWPQFIVTECRKAEDLIFSSL